MKRVKIAELKDQLSKLLRAVEQGAEVEVLDRERAIARIIPAEPDGGGVLVLPPSRSFSSIRRQALRPRPVGGELDPAASRGATAALNVYLDSSVLRVVLGEPNRLRIWARISQPVSSELVRLECLRTIDRARIRLGLEDETVAERRAAVLEAVETFNLVPLRTRLLERAADPFPTMLGSLYAVHLASALLARDRFEDLSLATHDDELAVAARAMGFRVHGAPAAA